MATLQKHGDGWYCQFLYAGKRRTLTIGKVPEREANQWKVRTEQLLLRLKQNLLKIPLGVSIIDFILHDGNPPVDPALSDIKETTFDELKTAYTTTFSNGAIEANTLSTAKIHLVHIETTLGKRFVLSGLTLGRLQQHVDRRLKHVAPVTIQKEIATFRVAWNWGCRSRLVQGAFPSSGLVYPKSNEKLPFMSMIETERRINAGGDSDKLWESLYLDAEQVADLLKYVKSKKAPAWVYPMIAMAAHTGARRSELMRAKTEDIDLANSAITIREKKRARGTFTTRRVPISGRSLV